MEWRPRLMDLSEFNAGQSRFTIVRPYLKEGRRRGRKAGKKEREKRKGKETLQPDVEIYTWSSQPLRKLRQDGHLDSQAWNTQGNTVRTHF